jgi:hypothetical protein
MPILLLIYGIDLIDIDLRFLLAQLYMDSITNQQSPRQIKRALQDLTWGIKGLDAAYDQAMARIEYQEEEIRVLAKQVLSWITCARRPLTTLELRYALAVEVGEPGLDEENLPEIEDMVSVCAGFQKLLRLQPKSAKTNDRSTPCGILWTEWSDYGFTPE